MGKVRGTAKAALAVATLLLACGLAAAVHWLQPAGVSLVNGQVYLGKSPAPLPAARVATSAFCATDGAAADRTPDLVAGPQMHVIYAFPSDGADRYAALAPAIEADLAAIDAWWRRQDPSRSIRWDLHAFPGCTPGLDQLDISRVQLAQPASYYSAISTRGGRLIGELGRTFADPSKKYLVYYDAPVEEIRLCGQSSLNPDSGGRFAYALVYAQTCHADIGSGALTASVAAHEMGHNLGAVPPGGPPHACSGDVAHICDDENDLMFPYTRGQGLNAVSLDASRDDYYGHPGGWWDLQDSPWLVHAARQFALSVSVDGTGTGVVSSRAPGISCPTSCSALWDEGTKVELVAQAGDSTRFVGWSGACTADPCAVTMSAAQTVVARFAARDNVTVVLRKVGAGTGSVRSVPAGISCPGTCSAAFDRGSKVRLVASAPKNSAFNGWTGACAGKAECSLVAGPTSAVIATFAPAQAFRPPAPKCKPGQRSTPKKPCKSPRP